jgi:hypothetical protein
MFYKISPVETVVPVSFDKFFFMFEIEYTPGTTRRQILPFRRLGGYAGQLAIYIVQISKAFYHKRLVSVKKPRCLPGLDGNW